MQLTQFTDYSLRVLIYLGLKGKRATAQEIADNFAISRNHLAKVIHRLGRTGYIDTIKGKSGGVELGKDPALIKIGQFIVEMEPNMEIVECFNEKTNKCPIIGICGLERILRTAHGRFVDSLNETTLADLLRSSGREQRMATLKITPTPAPPA